MSTIILDQFKNLQSKTTLKAIEENGRLKPEFQKGFHASGHVSREDIRWAIETINPDIIIPVHTENPSWFAENFNNVVLLKEGKTYDI